MSSSSKRSYLNNGLSQKRMLMSEENLPKSGRGSNNEISMINDIQDPYESFKNGESIFELIHGLEEIFMQRKIIVAEFQQERLEVYKA